MVGVAVVVGSNFSSRRSSRSSQVPSTHMIEARSPAANSPESHTPFGNPYKAFGKFLTGVFQRSAGKPQ